MTDGNAPVARGYPSTVETREVVTLFVPDGYQNAGEFLKDCAFERAEIPTPQLLEMLIKRLQWDGSQAELNSITIGEMRRAI